MQLLDKLKRRLLNLWLLDYTLPELWEWLRLTWVTKNRPGSSARYAYGWHAPTLFFDQVLVISLPFRTDRQERIRRQMSQRQVSFAFFEAIHGQSLDLEALDPAFFSRYSTRNLPKGSLGCALSHIRAWQHVAEQRWEYCLILEDDVVLTDSFVEDLRVWMPEVPPDFDILYLGSGLTAPAHIRQFVSPHVFVPYYPREGMYAYVVSAQGVQHLLQRLFPINLANGGIDTAVGKLVRKQQIRAYHLLPVLCHADLESPSNVPNPGGRPKPLDVREQMGE